MQEHIKTEQDLNEEQMQAITGGCAQCVADIRQSTDLYREAETHAAQAQLAQQRIAQATIQEVRNTYLHFANLNSSQAVAKNAQSRSLLMGVIARHPSS